MQIFFGICTAFFVVGAAVTVALNCRFLYGFAIDHYDLVVRSGLTKETLMENYRILIAYNNLYGPDTLDMPDFPTSATGAIHFAEVRTIFRFFEMCIPTGGIFMATGLVNLNNAKKAAGRRSSAFANPDLMGGLRGKSLPRKASRFLLIGGVLPFLTATVLGICCAVDWDRTFVAFHQIMFDNDYWIFDAATDPVIRVLPDGFFLMEAVLIFILAALGSLLCVSAWRRGRRAG